MPNLPIFNAPEDTITPNDMGERANVQAGRMAGQLGRETGNYIKQGGEALAGGIGTLGEAVEKHAAQNEINTGAMQLAELTHDMDIHYHQLAADPNNLHDPDFSKTYMEQYASPALNEFIDKFQTPAGKQWAIKHAADTQTEQYRQFSAMDMQRAGDRLENGISRTVNSYSNLAASHPESLEHYISMFESTKEALIANSTLPKDMAEKVRQDTKAEKEIVVAGIRGAMQTNPAQGLAMIQSEKYNKYISGTETETLIREARTFNLALRADARDQRAADDREATQASHAAAGNLLSQVKPGPDNTLIFPPNARQYILDQVALRQKNPKAGMDAEVGEAWLSKIDAQGVKADTAVQKQNARSLFDRLSKGPDDPNYPTNSEVLEMAAKPDGIAEDDRKAIMGLLDRKDPADTSAIKNIHNQIVLELNPPVGVTLPDGTQNTVPQSQEGAAAVTAAEANVWQKIKEGQARGLAPAQVLNPNDKINYAFPNGFGNFKNGAGALPEVTKQTQQEKQANDRIDDIMITTSLLKNNNPQTVNAILKDRGITGIDVTKDAWCAAAVREALPPELRGNSNNLAESFLKWGSAVDAAATQKGDVFYDPASRAQGYTGHVGYVLGDPLRTVNGQLSIHVVSTSNNGEPQWRPLRDLQFRRSQPPVAASYTGGIDWGALGSRLNPISPAQ